MSWLEEGMSPSLTDREQMVLELVANGYSAKEAAGLIGIAPRTVEGHIESVRLKLRARNRAHMVTQAVLGGFLKIEAKKKSGLRWPKRIRNKPADLVALRATAS